MQAKSINAPNFESAKTALENALQGAYQPTLAIVFISVKQDRHALCALLADKHIDVFGLTSCGEFTDQQQSNGAIVLLLLDLPREHYTILFEEIEGNTLADAIASLSRKTNQAFDRAAMIISSGAFNPNGEYFDGEGMIAMLKKFLKPNTPFYGGMAGDDWTLKSSFVFTGDKETSQGVMALVLDADKVQLQGKAIIGWQKLGITRTVTKSKGKLLYTIDDRPAIDMYLKYLGKEDKSEDASYKIFNEVGLHFPFIVNRESGETVLRTPMKINLDENALEMDLEMPIGTKFWFSMPPDFDIVDNILEDASSMKAASRMDAEALLIFSCAGRVDVLGPLAQSENEGLQQIWDAPMAGFFTYGEYGPDTSGTPEFHSGACCWVALKEKSLN